MTDSEFVNWIKNGGRPTVLVEAVARVAGVETTLYMSNTGYTTSPSDAPPNQNYLPVLRQGLTIRSEINMDGSPSISWGDVELDNTGGVIDEWLNYVWRGRSLNIYVGDSSWVRSDFRHIFVGTMDGIGASGRDLLNIKLRDKMELLNTSVTDTLIGGASNNKDKLVPMLFGECHNIEPVLKDPTTLRYKIHNGPVESIIEVRDEGVPVDFTPYLSVGEFTLANSPIGTVTVSAQGHKFGGTYRNTVAKLIQGIVTEFGTTPLTAVDIDVSNFNAFDAANQQAIGIYLTDKANIAQLISDIGGSIGAQAVFSPSGLLQLHRILPPELETPTTSIGDNHIKLETFSIDEVTEVKAAVKLNYCKNWTVQENLRSAIPPEHKDLYAKEWFEAREVDSTVGTIYNLPLEVEAEDTYLLSTSDAENEAIRRLELVSNQRMIISFTTNMSCILTLLGGYVSVTNKRYGFASGKTAQVLSVTLDPFKNEIQFQVFV